MLLAFVSDPLRRPVGYPHAQGGEACLELSFGTSPPADLAPLSLPQHIFGRPRQDVWRRPTRASAPSRRPDHLHIGGVDFEMTGDTDSPDQFASREPLAERRTLAIAGIRQHAAKAHASRNNAIEFFQRNFRLRARLSIGRRDARTLQSSWRGLPKMCWGRLNGARSAGGLVPKESSRHAFPPCACG